MAKGHVLLFVLLIFPIVFGWNGYERPIRLANQQLDGPFEWELRVEHILTMSALREHDEYSIHDFEPNSMAWIERDKDQLKICLQNRTLLAALDPQNGTKLMGLSRWTEKSERALPSLIQLNGRHQRLWGVNDQIPGPTLIAIEGTEIHLRIKNRLLMESLTIHLHGLTLPSKWYFDGVAPIQQCPIAVKSDFAFHFRATPAGTHWYHGQFPDGHQSNGLLGPLIVLPKGGIKEDRDFVAILQDWPKIGTEEQEENWAEGIVNENKGMDYDGIWSILVNQKGWHDRKEIIQKPSKIPWTRFPVGRDEKIRLRLIHGGYRHPLVLHIEGHKMELIASDGTDLQPNKKVIKTLLNPKTNSLLFWVDSLIIYPGERFDVRIQTLANPRHSIYRIVVGMAEQFLTNNPKNPIYGLAELEYDGNGARNSQQKVDFRLAKCASRNCTVFGCPFQHSMVNSTFNIGDGRKFGCFQMEELKKAKQPEKIGQNETLVDIDEEWGNWIKCKLILSGKGQQDKVQIQKHVITIDPFGQTVDGFNFQMPNSTFGPFFLGGGQMENVLNTLNCSNCAVKPCKCFYYKRFAKGRRVQITFVNQNGPKNASSSSNFTDLFRQSFSIHLHGIKFNVLKIGYPTMNFAEGNLHWNSELEKCKMNENCTAFSADFPINGMEMRKDTVLVPFGGYTTILFNADNPGWWIAETQQKGKGSVKFAFAIGEDEEMPKAPMNFPSDCGNFEPGMGIYGQFLA